MQLYSTLLESKARKIELLTGLLLVVLRSLLHQVAQPFAFRRWLSSLHIALLISRGAGPLHLALLRDRHLALTARRIG